MAGKLWLWCGGRACGPASAAASAEYEVCLEGGTQPSGGDAVLLWGSSPLPPRWKQLLTGKEGVLSGVDLGMPWLLNANAAAVAAMDGEQIWGLLEAAGLHVGAEGDSGRLYRIAVAAGEPLLAQRVRPDGWRKGMLGRGSMLGGIGGLLQDGEGGGLGQGQLPQGEAAGGIMGFSQAGEWRYAEDPAMRRSVRTALRSVYDLGLDLAEVLVRSDDSGRTSVAGLRLPGAGSFILAGGGKFKEAPYLPQAEPALWEAMLARAQAALQAGPPPSGPGIRIGADPEFIILRPDGRIYSASQLGGLNSAVGSDVLLTGRQLRQPVGELRPEPSASAEGLAASIRLLLARASRRGAAAPGMRLLAGAMPLPGLPLGGHVHLSGVPLNSRLLRVLDSYAAFPMALAEDPRGRARRPRYGMLGDSRPQPHGGFEYRTLPSWLVSPAAARYALAVSMLAAEDYKEVSYLPSLDARFVRAYYEGDKETLALCLPGLRRCLQLLPSYPKHREWLEPFLDAASSGACWDESRDLRIRWGIPVPGM